MDSEPKPESKTATLVIDFKFLNLNNSLLAKFSLKLI